MGCGPAPRAAAEALRAYLLSEKGGSMHGTGLSHFYHRHPAHAGAFRGCMAATCTACADLLKWVPAKGPPKPTPGDSGGRWTVSAVPDAPDAAAAAAAPVTPTRQPEVIHRSSRRPALPAPASRSPSPVAVTLTVAIKPIEGSREAAAALRAHILRAHGGRMRGVDLGAFYVVHPRHKAAVGKLKLKGLCEAHPDLLEFQPSFERALPGGFVVARGDSGSDRNETSSGEGGGESSEVANGGHEASSKKAGQEEHTSPSGEAASPSGEAAVALRNFVLRAHGGRANGSQLGVFYDAHPRFKEAVGKGNLRKICKAHPDLLELQLSKGGAFIVALGGDSGSDNDGGSGREAASEVAIGGHEEEVGSREVAIALRSFAQGAPDGQLRGTRLGEFYRAHPRFKGAVGKLKDICKAHPDLLEFHPSTYAVPGGFVVALGAGDSDRGDNSEATGASLGTSAGKTSAAGEDAADEPGASDAADGGEASHSLFPSKEPVPTMLETLSHLRLGSSAGEEEGRSSSVAFLRCQDYEAAIVSAGEPPPPASWNEALLDAHFYPPPGALGGVRADRTAVLVGESQRNLYGETGLLGTIIETHMSTPRRLVQPALDANGHVHRPAKPDQRLFLNVHAPFALVAVGVQGSGKSHTLACVVENCLLRAPFPATRPLTTLERPMAVLALHYGHDGQRGVSAVCEIAGVVAPSPALQAIATQPGTSASSLPPPLPRAERLVVLVSPTYYRQRCAFYKGTGAEVRPLLFRWEDLSAQQLRVLMRLDDDGNQLYVAVMLDLLRRHQRDMCPQPFDAFMSELQELCDAPGQTAPLLQRIRLLESIIAESEHNLALAAEKLRLADVVKGGAVVIADLTDPLVSPPEANAIFQVLLGQFRACRCGAGKLLALDEAHRYLDARGSGASFGLAKEVVDTVRLMRHEGCRVAIATQSPLTLAPELLELASVAVLHSYQSEDWHSHLSQKVPLPSGAFDRVLKLPCGHALLFSRRAALERGDRGESHGGNTDGAGAVNAAPAALMCECKVRPRITCDLGVTNCTNIAT